jgi:hypothetical protein
MAGARLSDELPLGRGTMKAFGKSFFQLAMVSPEFATTAYWIARPDDPIDGAAARAECTLRNKLTLRQARRPAVTPASRLGSASRAPPAPSAPPPSRGRPALRAPGA